MKLPSPKYIVFYNRTAKHEPIEKLKLSDAFMNEAYKKGLLEERRELGLEEGRETACMENARKLFLNGASYELVKNSITGLSEKVLREIYDEVMASKN